MDVKHFWTKFKKKMEWENFYSVSKPFWTLSMWLGHGLWVGLLSIYLLVAEKGDIYSTNLRLRLSDFAHGTKNVLPAFSRENSII